MSRTISSARQLYIIIAVFLLALAASSILAVLVGGRILDRLVGNTDLESFDDYAAVIKYSEPIPKMTVTSSAGVVEIPIDGKINVVLPQYVNCPDVCHWESSIIVYLMKMLMDDGLIDEVAFVTIGTNPYYETLQDGVDYMNLVAGDLIDQGVFWIWVQEENYQDQKPIWEAFKIAVQPYCIMEDGTILDTVSEEEFLKLYEEQSCETYGVTHTAGFIVVDRDGYMRYFISPTDDGWKRGQDKVAEAIYNVITELLNS
ncbi:MAG: hypothetical protein F7B20_04125 [Aeropyrum sp.]|nr:hypothetical protein [Aeropyrum sp.]MCE4615554.1 hypothetical protein [Aeropyrum sp.]